MQAVPCILSEATHLLQVRIPSGCYTLPVLQAAMHELPHHFPSLTQQMHLLDIPARLPFLPGRDDLDQNWRFQFLLHPHYRPNPIFTTNSKYIGNVYIVQTVEEGYQTLLEKYGDEQEKIFVFSLLTAL